MLGDQKTTSWNFVASDGARTVLRIGVVLLAMIAAIVQSNPIRSGRRTPSHDLSAKRIGQKLESYRMSTLNRDVTFTQARADGSAFRHTS